MATQYAQIGKMAISNASSGSKAVINFLEYPDLNICFMVMPLNYTG